MQKLIMTKGLPGSGKTTWAKQQNAKRVNKDDLRAMLDNGKWSKENEKHVLRIRDEIVMQSLDHGYDVIVDDTNLDPKHEEALRAKASLMSADFEIKDFTDVSLSTCLKRDSERANSVGEKVIKSMYNSYLRQKGHVAQYTPVPVRENFPYCIIVDIDGTLAHMNGRSPYDYTQVHTDVVDENVREVIWRYSNRSIMDELPDTYVIVVSGRMDNCKAETQEWLKANQIPYDEIYMRKTDDTREDSIVKREIYETWIKPRFNVRFVLDDRDRVVKMWREQGLKVLQVAEGDF